MEAADEVGEDQYWIYTGEGEVPDDVTHVRVSDDVTVLRKRAFSHRERLVAVELNEGLLGVGDGAFYSCNSLEYVRIPTSVTTIGAYAFKGCIKLGHVEFSTDSRIGAIWNGAFVLCASLTGVTLPKSLRVLGESAFDRCRRLKRVDLTNTTLTAIEDYTFHGCISLEDVSLSATVETIGKQAFHRCDSLSSVILHEGIKTINELAFSGCNNLSIDTLPCTVEIIAAGALMSCNLRHFISPPLCRELHISTFHGCKRIKSIQIIGEDTELVNGNYGYTVSLPSLLRMNWPKLIFCAGGGSFPCPFLSNLFIAADSTMTEGEYQQTFGEFNDKGCTLDQMKSRFKQLPFHEICFDYSNQRTNVTFKQVLRCLEENNGALHEKDCIGMTPLHIIACSTNHDVRLFQILISKSHKTLLDCDIFGRTALDYALLSDAPDEVFYLLFEPLVKMGELRLNLELIDAAVEHSVPALQTWQVFSDYLERFFPALELDWEDLFSQKVHQNSEMPIEIYRWFTRKAAKQRMVKMNTLTLTRQSKIDEMINDFKSRDDFPRGMQGGNQWRRQVGPIWKLMKLWELKEATVLLELALWKCRLDDSSMGSGSRAAARVSCGAEVIINEVVQFLSCGDFEAEIFGEAEILKYSP